MSSLSLVALIKLLHDPKAPKGASFAAALCNQLKDARPAILHAVHTLLFHILRIVAAQPDLKLADAMKAFRAEIVPALLQAASASVSCA